VQSSEPRFEPPASEHTPDGPIRVVVAEKSQMGCELLSAAMKRFRLIKIVGSVTNSEDALREIQELDAQIALISLGLQDGSFSGLRVVREIQTLGSRCKTILIMDDPDQEHLVDAFRAGAAGVFKRSEPLNLLARCIVSVNKGQIWVSRSELAKIVETLQRCSPLQCLNTRGEDLLSKREKELLPLVASGLSNREISARLNLSEHTVKNHLGNVYDKLGISSRVELILYATRREPST
jgi:DNA-binding NarL/FixJ family response regulator